MPYIPQAPPLIQIEGDTPAVYVGSPISEIPVTAVTAVTEILNMSLSQFATAGRAIQVRVPWLQETLWWVPSLEQVGGVMARGVPRGRIWTARELADLARIGASGAGAIETVARIKLDFDAEVESVEVAPGEPFVEKEPPQ